MKLQYAGAVLFVLLSAASFGQNQVAHINDIYRNRVILPDEVVPLVDPVSKQFALCLFKGQTINGFLFDNNYRIIDSLVSEDKQREYKQIFGKTVLDSSDYVIFITNNRRKKFASVRFSFGENRVGFTELNLDLGNEKIIQTVDYDSKFHVFTIVPRTSIVNVYRFDDAKSYVKFPLDFSNQVFIDEKQREVDLYDLLTINSGMYGLGKSVDLVKIEPSNPTALEMACNPTKFYSQDNKVFISFDQNQTVTQLIDIDLKTMNGYLKTIKKPLETESYKKKDGNSFLNGDVLYQIATTRNFLHLRALNYNTKKIIHEHRAHVNASIPFKNSSIIQTGGAFDNHREFESTDKLLRKVKRGKAGISVFNTKDVYQVSFGGVIESKVNPVMMMPGFGIPIASLGAVTLFFNPAFFAFQSYTHTKALAVDGLFNENFEHRTGEIAINVFDRIQKFEEEEKISKSGKTLFRINDTYILGSYDAFNSEYGLWAFER